MTGVLYSALFLLIWYAGLLRGILTSGFQSSYMLFLAAGLIPLFTAVQTVRRVLFYRRQREEIKAAGNVSRGRIVNVIMKSSPYEDSHHRTRYRRYYFLEAEVGGSGDRGHKPDGEPGLQQTYPPLSGFARGDSVHGQDRLETLYG